MSWPRSARTCSTEPASIRYFDDPDCRGDTQTCSATSDEWPLDGSVARADALDAFSRYPSDDELLDTLLEGAAAYDLSITRNLGWPEAARLAIDALARRGKRSRVAIEHRLDNLRPGSENAYSTWILLGALARMGFELPGRYDEWVSKMKQSRVRMNDVLDTVVQAMPPARRALL
jgi:hypothetical protein